MTRIELLKRLADARARAERAHLDIVIHGHEADKLRKAGQDASQSHRCMKEAENAEQKHIAEMVWLLDQLDKLE